MSDSLKWRSRVLHKQEEAILGLLEGKSRYITNIHELVHQTTLGLSLNDIYVFASMGFEMHVSKMVSSSVSFTEDVHQENVFIPKRTKVVVPASSYKRTGYTMKFVGSIHPDYSKGITFQMNRHNKMVKTNKIKRVTNYYMATGDILKHYYNAATGKEIGIDVSVMEAFFEVYDRVHVQIMQSASLDPSQRSMMTSTMWDPAQEATREALVIEKKAYANAKHELKKKTTVLSQARQESAVLELIQGGIEKLIKECPELQGVQLYQRTDILHGNILQECIDGCSRLHLPWEDFPNFMIAYIESEPVEGATFDQEFAMLWEKMADGDM